MTPMVLVPIAMGVVAVLQGSLNRRVAANLGLPLTVLLTHGVALACACGLWLWLRAAPSTLPSLFQSSQSPARVEWWYFVPGIVGFLFVCGMPLAFARLGVYQSLLLLIVSQLCLGLAWDRVVEGRSISSIQLLGAGIAVAGASLVLRR